jgi:arylsulfatase A-like enzyme
MLAAHGVGFALWLTSAFAVAAYASGDRYPGTVLLWTAALLCAGLLAPLALLGAAQRARPSLPSVALASAYCVLFAAALSLDVGPDPRPDTSQGAARLLLLAACFVLAAWNLVRSRSARLSLGHAIALLGLAWILCGLLRAAGAPQALARPAVLIAPAAALALLLPGLPRFDPLLSRVRLLVTLAAAAILVLLPWSPRVPLPTRLAAPAPRAPPTARSAILIVLDTLRRDHMSLYGYHRKTTPSLDRRAQSALVFDDATAVAPWTLPSHASMFTGLWPRTHGAHAFRSEKAELVNVHPLSPEHVTLAEIAAEHGYRTVGFSSNNGFMSSRWGMDQGFQEYLCRRPRKAAVQLGKARELAWRWDKRRTVFEVMPYFTAQEMTRTAISWLEQHNDTPFFLFLNYMDVHFPNAAPGTQGLPFEDEGSLLGTRKHEDFSRYTLGGALTPAERRGFVNEYDRELIYLDHWLEALFQHLESSGLAKRTLVVLTSDHGEFLGEHELINHMKDLYNEVVNVPLIVWEPGAQAGRVTQPAQSLDVFPTILRYLGLPVPPGAQGQGVLETDHPTVSELHYALPGLLHGPEGDRYDRILRTIRVDGYRYFNSTRGEERAFHLRDDPLEARSLIAERPDLAAAGRARLEEWLRTTPEAVPPARQPGIDPEALKELRSLGYVR